jgi:pyridoxal phosphate enzyme (YggS family)
MMVAENVENIRERIARACAGAKRPPEEVTLIAVSKTFGAEKIREAMQAGLTDFGENYAQELREKHDLLGHSPPRWHFIGHLQSNKVRHIVPWIASIQSVDSARLAGEISRCAAVAGHVVAAMVEVNTSGETSKYGVAPDRTLDLVREIRTLPHIDLRGLMTIGPLDPDPEVARPAFRLLRELRDECSRKGMPLSELSMGMTNDFEVAIEEGSTMIRIGTALFGRRPAKATA